MFSERVPSIGLTALLVGWQLFDQSKLKDPACWSCVFYKYFNPAFPSPNTSNMYSLGSDTYR